MGKFRDHDMQHLRRLAAEGCSIAQASRATGWSRVTLWRYAKAEGLLFRKGSRTDWNTAKLAAEAPRKPRIIIDMSGGIFQGATANTSIEVIVIDELDHENPRARIPGYRGEPWATFDVADVEPEHVEAAFDGLEWLDEEER